MKVLFLSQGKEVKVHPGWNDALVQLKDEGQISNFCNIPYFGYAEKHGWEAFYSHVVTLCKEQHFNLVYFHHFHKKGKPSPRSCIKQLLKLIERPIVITSVGDGFSDNWMWPDYPKDFKAVSQLSDITFSTQMGKTADKMTKWGVKNIVLMPNGMCQARFKAQIIEPKTHKFDFDVVFVGSKNKPRIVNPISKYWFAAREREKLVMALYGRYGKRFGLFGNGWDCPASQGPIPFNQSQESFRKGRIVVGGNPYSYSDYSSSNRPFIEISSGIPTIELATPRFDNILRNNDHFYFSKDIKDVIGRCDELLDAEPNELYQKAAKAAQYIEEKHTHYHRMKFIIDTVKRFVKNNNQLDVHFPFFLPEVNLVEENEYAARINN